MVLSLGRVAEVLKLPKKCMVHHGDVEKALRSVRRSMQHECRVVNRREFFKKPSDAKREVRIALQKKFKRNRHPR